MNLTLLEGGGGQSPYATLIMFGGVFLVMYFFMIRPQQKKRKELEMMRSNLSKGDNVIAGGIYGKVLKIEDETVTIEIEEGKMKVSKQFIEKLPE